MQKWQYMINEDSVTSNLRLEEHYLNACGDDGWELVFVSADRRFWIFKRPLSEEEESEVPEVAPPLVATTLRCTHPHAESGELYNCDKLDCPVHGPRNRLMAADYRRKG